MAATPKTVTPPALGAARPLSECFLLAQYEGAESLPASEATGESVRKMKLSAVRAVAPFLKEWVGEMAIRAVPHDAAGPTELYGPVGFALHFMGDEYTGWDAARDTFVRRLQCTQGHAVSADAPLPRITRLGLRYVDVWLAAEFSEIERILHWPVDAATREAFFRAASRDRREEDGLVCALVCDRELTWVAATPSFDGDNSARRLRARLTLDVEMQTVDGPAEQRLLPTQVRSSCDAMHQLSKVLLWRCMKPGGRGASQLFDDDEVKLFSQDDAPAEGA